jgi:fructokinase
VRLPLARRSALPTSLAPVTVDGQGTPDYRLYRAGVADKDISLDEIEAALPPDLEVFHTDSLAITPDQLPKILALIDLLRARNVLISVDVNVRLRGTTRPDTYLAGVRSLLSHPDIVKASNEDLAALYPGIGPRDAAAAIRARMKSGLMVLTEGCDGAALFTGNTMIECGAYPVARLADTIGAGDTFHAAFLASLLRAGALRAPLHNVPREPLAAAIGFAAAAAVINVSRVGCSPPSRHEVEELLHRGSRPTT